MIGQEYGWATPPLIGDWGANHPFVNGNGHREFVGAGGVPPRFVSDPDLVKFAGLVGYLAWTTHDRKANMRV